MIDITPALERIQDMANGLIAQLPNLTIALIVFILTFILAGITRTSVRRLIERSKRVSQGASIVLARLARILVIVGGVLIASSIAFPDLGATQLLNLLGIGTVAIGFAFQDIFQNLLAGILILITQPFNIGDQIIVGDYEGTVTDIQIRASNIRLYDGRRAVIPNSKLFTESVIVNTAHDVMRSEYDVGIGYDEDIEIARAAITDAIREIEGIYQDPAPEVLVMDLGASAVVLRVFWWTDPAMFTRLHVKDKVITAIKYRLDAENIEIPYQYQNILLFPQGDGAIAAD